jgi:hypothetical protein
MVDERTAKEILQHKQKQAETDVNLGNDQVKKKPSLIIAAGVQDILSGLTAT